MLDYKEEYHQYRLVMESHKVVAIHTATNKLVIPWAKKGDSRLTTWAKKGDSRLTTWAKGWVSLATKADAK